jgi:SpoIID/LytB domain protein
MEPIFRETVPDRRREPPPLVTKNEVKQKIKIPFFRKRVAAVRIGLGTDRLGRPLPCNEVTITCSSDFDLYEGTAAVKIRDGAGEDPWVLRRGQDGIVYRIFPTGGKERLGSRMLAFVPRSLKATSAVRKIQGMEDPSTPPVLARKYLGVIEIHPSEGGLSVVNQVSMEDYLASVAPAEITARAPQEAMKAQVVISRSLAVLGRFHESGYDLCDDQHCQVYRGVSTETPLSRKAARETYAEVMVYRGKVAHTVYSSNCGGRGISGAELEKWGGAPYWEGVTDGPPDIPSPTSPFGMELWIKGFPQVFCRPTKYTTLSEFRWARLVSARVLEERLQNSYPDIGQVLGVIVRRRAQSGHALTVEIVGSNKRITLDQEHRIRYLLAPGSIRSALISIQTIHEAGRPSLFLISGGGWGHGVGLCQSGAMGMADMKAKYKEILAHYYPACHIEKMQE